LHDADSLVSRRGSKRGYARAILSEFRERGLPDGRPSRVLIADADPLIVAGLRDLVAGAPKALPAAERVANDPRDPREVWKEIDAAVANDPESLFWLWLAGRHPGIGGGWRGVHAISAPDGFSPRRTSVLRRISKLSALDWTGVEVQCARLDDLDPSEFDAVYVDPPYQDTTGYDSELSDGEVDRFLDRCPALTAVSEASEITDRLDWIDITTTRVGQNRGGEGRGGITTTKTELLGFPTSACKETHTVTEDERREAMERFGTQDYPIRISSLPMLLACPRRGMLDAMLLRPDSGSAPADTGTLTGAMIEYWHRLGDVNAAVRAAIADGNTPLADEGKARSYFEGYCADPRNAALENVPADDEFGAVVNAALEIEVEFERGSVFFCGHLDQVRALGSRLYVWDVKCTNRLKGPAACNHYTAQLAGYTIGLAETIIGEDVQVGGIIRATDYFLKAVRDGKELPQAFYRFPLDRDGCEEVVKGAVQRVLEIRKGVAYPVSSDACGWACVGGVLKCLNLDLLMMELGI
jgi:hypothetical protein